MHAHIHSSMHSCIYLYAYMHRTHTYAIAPHIMHSHTCEYVFERECVLTYVFIYIITHTTTYSTHAHIIYA